MYISGNLPQLGFIGKIPQKMKKKHKIDHNGKWICFWELTITIENIIKHFFYRYGMKNKRDDRIIWEREPNRICNLINVKYYANNVYSPIHDLMGFAQKETLLFKERNNKHIREDSNFAYYFFYTQINDNLWLGPYPQTEDEHNRLKSCGIKAILNLQTDEDLKSLGLDNKHYEREYRERNQFYYNYQIIDNHVEDFNKHAYEASKLLGKLVEEYECVYVHCTAGRHRSPKIITLYLIWDKGYIVKEAVDLVKYKREQAKVDIKTMKSIIKASDSLRLKGLKKD